jgi:hypothetical protein
MTALYLPQWRQAIAEQEAALRRCEFARQHLPERFTELATA